MINTIINTALLSAIVITVLALIGLGVYFIWDLRRGNE